MVVCVVSRTSLASQANVDSGPLSAAGRQQPSIRRRPRTGFGSRSQRHQRTLPLEPVAVLLLRGIDLGLSGGGFRWSV
jgi:hypothetical protein